MHLEENTRGSSMTSKDKDVAKSKKAMVEMANNFNQCVYENDIKELRGID